MTTQTPETLAAIAELKSLGFEEPSTEAPRRLITSVSGHEKTGKTHFGLSAPPPIFYFDIDVGSEGVVEKFKAQGKEIYTYKIRIPKPTGPKDMKDKDIWITMWDDLKVRLAKCVKANRGAVVMDTASEMWDLLRLARFHKLTQVMPNQYGPVNAEAKSVIRWAYESDMSAVFLHKVKPEYVNDTRTGKYERSGFKDMEYDVQANVETFFTHGEGGAPGVFSLWVRNCRQNMTVAGNTLQGPMCNFDFLLKRVHD